MTNRRELSTGLSASGHSLNDVASVTVTHLHPDHLGLASWLSRRNDIPVQMHTADLEDLVDGSADNRYSEDLEAIGDRWGVPVNERQRLQRLAKSEKAAVPALTAKITDGEILPIPGRQIETIHTPGHTRGHTCFNLSGEQLLLSGDHILPNLYPGLGRGGRSATNPVADYLESLHILARFDDHEVAPGHGWRFRGLGSRRSAIAQHVLRRAHEVEAVLTKSPSSSTWAIASQLTWRAGWQNLSGSHTQSALSQTEMYIEFLAKGGAKNSN